MTVYTAIPFFFVPFTLVREFTPDSGATLKVALGCIIGCRIAGNVNVKVFGIFVIWVLG